MVKLSRNRASGPPNGKGEKTKAGVALVATLLLVAALMILGMLYLVQVRLERRTTDYQHAAAEARAGLEIGLGRAMRDIGASYADRVYPLPEQDHDWFSKDDGVLAGAWFDADDVAEWGWPEMVRGNGEGSLWERGENAEWVIVGEPDEWHLAVAWVGADLTGLLDPNMVGDISPRRRGQGPGAIPTEQELGFPRGARQYFTPGEFEADHPAATKVFMPGSRSVDDGWYDNGLWRQTLSLDGLEFSMFPDEWSGEQIRAVMAHLYPDGDAEKLAAAFVDFRDGARLPGDPDIPTAAPIPMFNEVVATLAVETTGSGVALTLAVDVEFWLPFLGSRVEGDFRVSEPPSVLLNGSPWTAEEDDLAFSMNVEPLEPLPLPDPAGPDGSGSGSPGSATSQDVIQTGRFLYIRELPGVEPGAAVSVEVNTSMILETEGTVIDRMPEITLTLDAVAPAVGGVVENETVREVLDPRLNYRVDLWVERDEHSLGELNLALVELMETGDPRLDPHWAWSPRALNPDGVHGRWDPSWVGFFPLDEPWRSVNLFGDDGRWWLRHTRDPGWESGVWRPGMVNPNSLHRQALEAAFLDVPLEKFPGDPNHERLVPDQTWNLAEDFLAALELEEGAVQRGDWTRILAGNEVLREMDRHTAESVVASMLNVFETRQQMWGLALVAEWRTPAGTPAARARARAVLWRDPYADEEQIHAWNRILWLTP